MFETLKDRRKEGKTTLDQARLVEIYLLEVFDEICKRHNLKYWLMYGTLLGAFRHDGFIPWDDDIDVGMEMEDYKKFLRIAPGVLPETIMLQTPKTHHHTDAAFAKLRDLCSFYCETHTIISEPCGIFLDIFPFERVPKLPKWMIYFLTRLRFGSHRHRAMAMMRLRGSALAKIYDAGIAMFWGTIHAASVLFSKGLSGLIGKSNALKVIDEAEGYPYVFECSWVFPLGGHVFEGKSYPVPAKAEKVLEVQYGNWKELPPENARHWHASIIEAQHAPRSIWAKSLV